MARVAYGGHPRVGYQGDILALGKQRGYLFGALALVVLMIAYHGLFYTVGVKKDCRLSGILARYDIYGFKGVKRPQRDVFKVAYGCAHDITNAAHNLSLLYIPCGFLGVAALLLVDNKGFSYQNTALRAFLALYYYGVGLLGSLGHNKG